ncbi:MAG: nucleotide sugar dehydrogenase [Chloroflexi bacterium]|nr:nucleotide sugar dehydrogenase [Chloroflexota bacterium]
MNICVVGLGKIGMTLAAQYASKSFTVVGCDINPQVVDAVNRGISPILEEEGLAERVASLVKEGTLRATRDTTAAVAASDVVVIIVPLIIDAQKVPDYRSLDAAAVDIGRGLHRNSLVINESTVPVGTTRNRLGKILETESGLEMGRDFSLAFSPERVYSGRIFTDLARYPKVVGAADKKSTGLAASFYRQVLDADVMAVDSMETAEFVKLIETTYRDVNIALANRFARYADAYKIDVMQAIVAANSQPFSHIHTPGVGVGGHCIPVYPYFFPNSSEEPSLISLARATNDGMAQYAVGLLRDEMGEMKDKSVLILGLAYRGDVKEAAFSSTWLLVEALEKEGARVFVHDPLFSTEEIQGYGLRAVELERLPPLDAVVLQSYHSQYKGLDFGRLGCKVVLDGRNVLDREDITRQGLRYIGIGR